MEPRPGRTSAALAGALALLSVQPVLLGWVGPLTLLVPVAAAGLAYVFSRVEDAHGRRLFWRIWALAMIVRFAAILVLVAAQSEVGAVLLGPDGAQYLTRALELARSGLRLPESPISAYGTHDVGPYYFFASLVSGLGESLISLQIANASVGALVAPLTFSWTRLVLPERAVFVGILVALYPTGVVLGAADLLKDPALMFATALAIWAIAHLGHGLVGRGRIAALTGAATLALLFIHVSRSYILFFLLVGLALASAWLYVVRRRSDGVPAGAWGVVAAFLVAELAFVPLGWPVSGRQLWTSAHGVLEAASVVSRAGPERTSSVPAQAFRVREDSVAMGSATTPALRVLRVETEVYRALPPSTGVKGQFVSVVRKVFGPFVWVLPPDWSARTLLAGDYLLYPGTVVWYGLWPFMAAGLVLALGRLAAGRSPVFLGGVGLFTLAYLVMYLALNLSYRHRAGLFPLLAVFAAMGWDWSRRLRYWRLLYAVYWLGLAALATAHLVARARLA